MTRGGIFSEKIDRICLYCQSIYRGHSLKYCSVVCAGNARVTRVKRSCDTCGTIVERYKSVANRKHAFCSDACMGRFTAIYRAGSNSPHFKMRSWIVACCLTCRRSLLKPKSNIKRPTQRFFCNLKCKGKYLSGRRSPSWTGATKKFKCTLCKKIMYRQQSDLRRTGVLFCSDTHFRQYYSGARSPVWRGGISKLPYGFDFTNVLKEQIRQRDGRRCRLCGSEQSGRIGYRLPIHHIDYDKTNCRPSNLLTTCLACNARANFNRPMWTERCRQLIGEVN